jgi:hypothetical protein
MAMERTSTNTKKFASEIADHTPNRGGKGLAACCGVSSALYDRHPARSRLISASPSPCYYQSAESAVKASHEAGAFQSP